MATPMPSKPNAVIRTSRCTALAYQIGPISRLDSRGDRSPAVPSAPALLRDVIRLAWPAVVQGLLTTVVFFTDRLILGGYSDLALGSMSISGPLMWSVMSVFGAISAGTMAVVGRRVGAG